MKKTFKPLALAAAVASTGYMAGASAQSLTTGGLGDMAIIPYYTVEGDYQTGIHIINTSEYTQVVKLRFRRASDSMDALDLNLVMSPKDVWTGSLSDDTGTMKLVTDDSTCTVPRASAGQPDGTFEFPSLYREGAEEGYVEVIAMGEPNDQTSPDGGLDGATDEDTAIAEAAEHVNGVPRSCNSVRENFFSRNGVISSVVPAFVGNVDYDTTQMEWWDDLNDIDDPDVDPEEVTIEYRDSDNALRVSWFLRDAATGLEFGDEAVHVEDFLGASAMTNQQFGLFSGDITGFDYPDLNGGVPDGLVSPVADSANGNRDRFQVLRSILGVDSVLNDWSTASERNVSTDWVVTFPGQYTMLDYYLYTVGEVQGVFSCGAEEDNIEVDGSSVDEIPECDFRDLPVRADLDETFDREEDQLDPEDGELVVSPSIPGQQAVTELQYEVNVIEWTNGENSPVLDSNYTVSVDTSGYSQPFGWAQLSVTSNNNTSDPDNRPDTAAAPAICDWDGANESLDGAVPGTTIFMMNCAAATGGIPMVGFVAWERSFPSDPSANYGRIIPHASTQP